MPLNRRAFLGGGIVATLYSPLRAGPTRLEAAALPDGSLGYNGASPGPLLRLRAGGALSLRFANLLDKPTSLAFPGAGSAGGFSGLTGPPIAPGGEKDIEIAPLDPGFHLYVPYGPASTAEQLGAGLFGPLVIDEPSPPPADLDAIVVLSGADGARLKANAGSAPLKLSGPPGGRARVRLANATPDLVITLKVSGATAHIVAIDGTPSELFEPLGGEFPMAPSARFELMLDLPEAAGSFVSVVSKGDDERPLLQIGTAGERAAAKPAIRALPVPARLPPEIALERARQVSITLSGSPDKGFAVNGMVSTDWPAKPLFRATRGAPVSLTLINRMAEAQTMRLEGHVARQLHALDDGWDPYWRDALLIGASKTLHAAFAADMPGKWPLASASPSKRAKGLAAWYLVT